MYKIQCDNLDQFVLLCFEFMKKGATYQADAYNLVIDLTGGF
jgi:hypothetical protein